MRFANNVFDSHSVERSDCSPLGKCETDHGEFLLKRLVLQNSPLEFFSFSINIYTLVTFRATHLVTVLSTSPSSNRLSICIETSLGFKYMHTYIRTYGSSH